MNNDVLLIQKDYLELLSEIKYSKDIGAIGTKILNSQNGDQNPIYNVKSFREACIGPFYNMPIFQPIFKLRKVLKNKITNVIRSRNVPEENNSIKNDPFILHGSVILLTENYLKIYPGLYPKTFMFFEENILDYLMKRHNLKALYFDSLVAKHKEDQSSSVAFDNVNSAKLAMLKNSWRQYLKLLLMTDKKIKRIFSNVKPEYEIKF